MKSWCNLSRTSEAEITLSVEPNAANTPKSIYPSELPDSRSGACDGEGNTFLRINNLDLVYIKQQMNMI